MKLDIKRIGHNHLFTIYHLDHELSISEESEDEPRIPATSRSMASLLSNLDMLVSTWEEDSTFLWSFKKNQYMTPEQGKKVGDHLSSLVDDKDCRLVRFGFSPLSGRELMMKLNSGIEIVFLLPAGQGRFVEPTGLGADPEVEVVVVAQPCLTPVELPASKPAAMKKPPPMPLAIKTVPVAVAPAVMKKKPHNNNRRESSGTLEPWDERKEDADLEELVDLIGQEQISTRSTDTEYTYVTVEDEE